MLDSRNFYNEENSIETISKKMDQSSSFFFINKAVIDKLIGIVEAKLEASLNDVEELIIKNNYDLKIAKQDV